MTILHPPNRENVVLIKNFIKILYQIVCDDIPVTGLLTPDLLVMESLYQDLLDSKSRAFQIHPGLLFGDHVTLGQDRRTGAQLTL